MGGTRGALAPPPSPFLYQQQLYLADLRVRGNYTLSTECPLVSELVSYSRGAASVRPSVRLSVCPSVNFSCPQPLWRHAWADFVYFAHEHHPWWGLDAHALDFWFDAALLTYAALQCWQPSHCVRAHCEDTHGWISFMLVLNITHGEVLMHMHWIFDLMLHCWLMLFFSADRLLLPYLWETGT